MVFVLFVFRLSTVVAAAETPKADLFRQAERFARAMLEADHETVRAVSSEAIGTAVSGPQSQQIREGLALQAGGFIGFGDPWIEERTEQYRRVRLPAKFTGATIDLKIVVDAEGKVVGVSMAEHEPPAAGSATVAEVVEGAGEAASTDARIRMSRGREEQAQALPSAGVREVDLTVGDPETGLPARL